MAPRNMRYRRLSAKTTGLWILIGMCIGLPLAAGSASMTSSSPTATAAALKSRLQERLDAVGPGTATVARGQSLTSPEMVRLFYQRRQYRPAWLVADTPGRGVSELLAALAHLRTEALTPEAYHHALLQRLVDDTRSSGLLREEFRLELMVDLELLASDAFLTSAGHLLGGRVDPETLDPEQQAVFKDADLIGALEAAAGSGDVQQVLRSFLPDHRGYRQLRRVLRRYRRISRQGGWPPLPDGPVLRPGQKDARVPVLRSRLAAEGYLARELLTGDERFDTTLKRAVMAFQRRHGLPADGAVGPLTRQALNIPASGRARQIELNMERWRWLPRYLGKRYLLVNIADFTLAAFDGDRPVMVMRAVVGKDYRRTPVFSAQLNKIVLNPHWYVPPTIFAEDLLPAIRANPGYLQQRGYKVFSSLGSDAVEVDPEHIEWQAVDPENFPYILRKDPGPFNPMGRAKFLFPNNYDVYLHDSPDRSVFTRSKRALSSGCIRIEKPVELTEYLLKDSGSWPRRQVLAEIESGRPKVIDAFAPLPIYIQYWTAWVDPYGRVQFREDIYGRDAALGETLSKMQNF